jgi:7-cyano-7-deazaguanine synthase
MHGRFPKEVVFSYVRQLDRRKMFEGPYDSVVIVSGGLDSTILVYDMIEKGYRPHMLSFNYGQRHHKELRFAEYTSKKLGLRHDIVDLTALTHLISNSALTSQNKTSHPAVPKSDRAIEVPEGHYAEDSMKATVVPNRNMIMLSIAAGIAVNNKYKTIATGVHGGDHFIYPDCRPEFIFAAGQAILKGNEGFHNFHVDGPAVAQVSLNGEEKSYYPALPIFTPYLNQTKADIAYRGIELEVPFEETWSCYKGGEKHCGRCGTCVERLEAIDEAERKAHGTLTRAWPYDATAYEDDTFWKGAVREGA